jgi:hypothetical protein
VSGDLDFAALMGPQFAAWLDQMWRLGGCSRPVYLVGHTLTRDSIGRVLHVFTSSSQPYGRYAVRCRNRRESVCIACSTLHRGDTYQIVAAGLAGGKGVPAEVAAHPRVFLTVTAPSFGAVHRRSQGTEVCRARRGECAHGVGLGCWVRHGTADPVIGAPLCLECCDCAGLVLWNAAAGLLWRRMVTYMPREMAKAHGVTAARARAELRVSYVKVAEFQARGSVHFHVVVRCDGPGGPGDPAPGWVGAAVLGAAAVAAVGAARVRVPDPAGGERVLTFGGQLDVQEIGGGLDGMSDRKVAAYLAKYVAKGDPPGMVLPHRLRSRGQIETTPGLSEYARALMHAAFDLAGRAEFGAYRLDRWAHQLGFRGHVATKSRRYSTTYAWLRAERMAFYRADDPAGVVTESRWRVDRIGHSPAEAAAVQGIALAVRDRRAAGRGRDGAGPLRDRAGGDI